MDRIRVGFIGAGRFANEVHYPSLAEFDDVHIAAICDRDPERLRTTAEAYGVEDTFGEVGLMLDQVELDAAYIVMPPQSLFDITAECLKRKLNVFIEKPPGVSAEQTRSFARLAETYGNLTMVGFNRRFMPVITEARRIVAERGRIQHCAATYYKHYLADSPYFDGPATMLTLDGIHAVDTLRWLGGTVESVVSQVGKWKTGYPNSFRALVGFNGGCTGVLSTDWTAGKRVQTLEIHSEGISAFIDIDKSALIYADDKEEPLVLDTRSIAGSGDFRVYYGFKNENRHFIDCIKSGTQPLTNFAEAVLTMELTEAIERG